MPKSSHPKPTPSPKPQTTPRERPSFQWRPKKTNPSTKQASPTPTKSRQQTATMQWRPKLKPTSSIKPLTLASPQSIKKPNHVTPMRQTARTSTSQSSIHWKSQMLQQLLQHKLSQPVVANHFAMATKARSHSLTSETKSTLHTHNARITPTLT